MMPNIPGYRLLTAIHRSNGTLTYRGVREADQRPLLIKTLDAPYPDPREIARLKREHQLLSTLDAPGVPATLGLVPWGNNLALLLADCPGEPLASRFGPEAPMPVRELLRFVSAAADVLMRLHPRLVHGSLSPQHFLWDAGAGALHLIEFGQASLGDAQPADSAKAWGGSPAYRSPEQSGRLNRNVDFRADLYALGILCYEALTGRLPFAPDDPDDLQAWSHCHLARTPEPLERLNPTVPPGLGPIVLRLMAKQPDDRYASARALRHDLAEAARRLEATGTIEVFPLGSAERAPAFELPARLYGREPERQALEAAYREATDQRLALAWVSGPAGVGKTQLAQEARRLAEARGGRFAEGKFEQERQPAPYAALRQALEALALRLAAEPEAGRAAAERLRAKLGPNARLAVDLAPGLEALLGPTAPLATLDPGSAHNRFLTTVRQLLEALAPPGQPLVLFLDDLQWADPATLALLAHLLETGLPAPLLLVGAFRDRELAADHPLQRLPQAPSPAVAVRRIRLEPLPAPAIARLVADALGASVEATAPLSAALHRQSLGNPLFATALLRSWHQDGLLRFEPEASRWRWELEPLDGLPVSEDVVAFLAQRIERMPPSLRRLLRVAACIGDRFDLALLTRLEPRLASAEALRPAVEAGLLAPLGPETPGPAWRFCHDRVRQAAGQAHDEAEKQRLHLAIGRCLLARDPEAGHNEQAPVVASHLNAARALLTTEAERLELAGINLAASRRAQAAAAYPAALASSTVARELLPPDAWERHYPLALAVTAQHTACAYLGGRHAEAEACFAEWLARARTVFERAEAHAVRAAHYTFDNRFEPAIEAGLTALRLLGIKLRPRPGLPSVLWGLLEVKRGLFRRGLDELESAPPLTDRAVRLAMRTLDGFLAPAYLSGNGNLFAVTVLKQVALTLRHGPCEEAVTAYAGYAVLLAGLGDLKGAADFGRLALRLGERFGASAAMSRAYVLYGLFSHSWNEPWETMDSWFRRSVEAGLRSGDVVFMPFACGYVNLWTPRADLEAAVQAARADLATCKQSGNRNALDAARCAQQLRLSLRGRTAGPLSLTDADFDEAACLARMAEGRYVSGLAIFHLAKLQLAYLNEAFEEAWQALAKAEEAVTALAGSPYMVDYALFGFLTAAQRARSKGAGARRRMRAHERKMRGWASHCPANFGHLAHLMRAERLSLGPKPHLAAAHYEAAAASARRHGFLRDEALAHECAARHFRAQGLRVAAAAHAREAKEGYRRWGATAKVSALEAAWGTGQPEPAAPARLDLEQVPRWIENGWLDLATLWRSTQALAAEPTADRLLARLLQLVKESAGAQRAVLILKAEAAPEPDWLIQAESPEAGEPRLRQAQPLAAHPELPAALIRAALRSGEPAVGGPAEDPDLAARQVRSALVLPLSSQGALLGALYLENRLVSGAFTPDRLAVLQILAVQAAVSLEHLQAAEKAAYMEAERQLNDRYARTLEARVAERSGELLAAYERLMALDALKTSFLSIVSHELRTPLTVIQGYAEFLEDEVAGPLTATQGEFLKQLQLGAGHLRRMVDDLLDFARIEADAFTLVWGPTSLNQTVREAIESLMPLLQARKLTLETELPEETLCLQADANRLAQVLLNLLGNAIKFTPPGGTLKVSLARTAGGVRIAVADTGPGIAPEHLPRLFQKFYQADSSSTREKGGLGLGLSIAQAIVEAHGGTIGAESVPGAGSTFWFELPGEPQGPEAAPPEAQLPISS